MKVQQNRRKRPVSSRTSHAKTHSGSQEPTPDAAQSTDQVAAATQSRVGLLENRTFWWSLLSAVVLPLPVMRPDLWWLAWLAPIGWLRVINMPQLDGLRPNRLLWLTGFVHWLIMTYWVTLPHPATSLGWLALSLYLSVYVVGFLAVARQLVHRAGWSSVIAAPVAWVAMEVLRSRLFSGFALCSLSHSQVDLIPLLQISKVTGAYGVSFLVMLGAAGIEQAIFGRSILLGDANQPTTEGSRGTSSGPRRWLPLLPPVVAVLAALAFGSWVLGSKADREPGEANATVAIIQGSLDTEFDGDVSKLDEAFKQYAHMTRKVTRDQKIDLVLWPESMFRFDTIRYDEQLRDQPPKPDFYSVSEWAEISSASTKKMVREFGTKCLLGTGTTHYHVDSADRYNTAGFFDANGEQLGAYHKMHPVMFGEYIPFGATFPWIYTSGITPLRSGLVPGAEPKAFEAAGVLFAPCICFENTVPHLIRRQVRQLVESGQDVDALVTLTNDGWFWGSKLLDVHLACGIFRAVENGRPMLIAANTGYSAEIDDSGEVLQKGPKRASKVLVANVQKPDARNRGLTFYTRFGDVFAISNIGLACVGLLLGRRRAAN